MAANGEWKIIWGATMIVAVYAIYMTCTPDPADGQLMLAVIAPIVAIVSGLTTKAVIKYRTLKEV